MEVYKKLAKHYDFLNPVVPYNAMRKSALAKYFARTKFKKVRYFGDYRFGRYSAKESERLIVVAQK